MPASSKQQLATNCKKPSCRQLSASSTQQLGKDEKDPPGCKLSVINRQLDKSDKDASRQLLASSKQQPQLSSLEQIKISVHRPDNEITHYRAADGNTHNRAHNTHYTADYACHTADSLRRIPSINLISESTLISRPLNGHNHEDNNDNDDSIEYIV